MSGPTYTLNSTYHPIEGTGIIRISFHDLRKSSHKNAEALVNNQLASLMKVRPAGTVITARLVEGKRFASSWTFEMSTVVNPAKSASASS